MALEDLPIQKKLARVILFVTCAVLLLTVASYSTYEYFVYRHSAVRQLSLLGKIIASNSTAALAFDSRKEAEDILSAIRAEQQIVGARLYDAEGNLFSQYPADTPEEVFTATIPGTGYYFEDSHLVAFEPVVQGDRVLGMLYLRSDMSAMYERFTLYGMIALLIVGLSLLVAYVLSRQLQKQVTGPILALAETAKAVSGRQDFSVRATKSANDETGLLTDAFNHMLDRIEKQTQEIRAFNQNLEQRIRERTHELQIANKELEAFSYSVSHDLRAPLRSIHGYMNIFSQEYAGQLDDEGKRLINIIISNGRIMGKLIDDLLAFSQLGRKSLHKREVAMSDMVAEIWNEHLEHEQNRKFDFQLKPLPPAMADDVTIRQVWTNLISNAIKYTAHNEVATIEIGAYDENDSVVYSVKDKGAGFDMKYYDKLFGVFQRLHSQEEFEGTGVGLAIVDRVISKHGGRVWAEAALDQGATFYFCLPKG